MYTPYELEKHMQHRNEELEQRLAKLRLIQESRVKARRAAQLRGRVYRLPALVLTMLRGA